MNVEMRKSVLQVHRWTGLTIGLVILMMALTGAVNLFRPSLEPVVNQELLSVPTCREWMTLDQLASNARAFHASGTLDYIRITAGEEGAPRMPAARIRFADPQDDVFLDPCTGRVLGERSRYGGFLGSVEQLHILRVSEDKVVRSITGVCAIVFAFVLIGGGIFMWWPRAGRVRAALTLNTRLDGRAWHVNLHKTAGVYAGAILLLLVLTGLPLAFDWYREGIYRLTNSPLPPKPETSQVVGADRISMEAFWQRVQALVPEPADALLKFAGARPDASLEGFVIERDAPHPNARTMLSLDAYSGKVLRFVPYSSSSLGHKLYFWTLSFHTGRAGGLPVQAALLAGVLTVPVLAWTGLASFLRRRRSGAATQPKTLDVRVRRIVDEAVGVKCYELVDATGAGLPAFTAGAHVTVHVGEGVARPYSLCNDPAQTDVYRIAVKRAAESRGGSRAMHERVKEGDILRIGAPRNQFPLVRAAQHHLLVASGIGITPMMAMAHHLSSSGASFELHYFSRPMEHPAFHHELCAPKFRGKVSFHHVIEPERLREALQVILGRRVDGGHLYLCGSTRFMDLVADVAAGRWPPGSVHTESFSPDPMTPVGERKAFEITLARSGGTYCVPASKSIIDVLREHAFCHVETSCEQGICGTCLTGLLDGVADHRDSYLNDEERSAGRTMLLCVSRARSERLVLDV